MRTPWLLAAAFLWLGCSGVYFLTAPGRIDIIDGGIRYRTAESLLARGTPDILDPATPAVFGRDARRFSFYPIGTPLMSMPFVALGEWIGRGSLEAKQFAYTLTSIPFAAATVATLFLILGRLGCTMPRAALWSLAVAFATPLWVYAGSTFDTAQQGFFLLLGVWAAVEAFALGSGRWAIWSGVGFALLVNVQETYLVLAGCVLGTPASVRALADRLRDPIVRTVHPQR
jgi:hypothetical protein